MLSLHELKFLDYGPFTFSVSAAEGISIQGSSGCGKTLLLRAIADLDQHTGQINLDKQPQNTIPGPRWRQRIGYLPADTYFWHTSVAAHFDNVEDPFIQTAITRLNVEALIQQPVSKLSSGEKQRLALLRLLANQPEALLLDEPTSHLDPDLARTAESVISDYQTAHQCPLILVSHDPEQRQRMARQHYHMQAKSLQEIAA